MQENETILKYDSFADFIVSLKQNVVGSTVGAIGLNSFKCKNSHLNDTYNFNCTSGTLSESRIIMGVPRTAQV